jgi:hypothetical protein
VTIYRGRPGGFLWFEPTLEQRTDIAQADVPAARVPELTDGKVEGSLGAALAYVRNLHQQIDETGSTTTSTTTSTGSVPPGVPTTPTST